MGIVGYYFNLEGQYRDFFDAYIRITVSYFYRRTPVELMELHSTLTEQFKPNETEQTVEINGEIYTFILLW